MKHQSIIGLCLLASFQGASPCFAEWNPTPVEESMAGGLSLGTGVLATIATPLIFAGDVSDNQGLGTASSQSVKHLGHALAMTGTGVVLLVDGTGKGLSELTTNSILATGTLVENTIETVNEGAARTQVVLRKKDGEMACKTIPLVVRPGYVQLHEKVGN